jgi:hypothetical protein
MVKDKACLLWIGTVVLAFSVAHAQSPQQIIQQVVNTEHAADENDHSQWVYLEKIRKPKEQVLQWVADTQQGDIQRILERNKQRLSTSQQRDLIQNFLHDPRAQKKQVSESNHDNKQIDDLLQLLPIAFLWTQTGATATDTFLHFEPAPHFHPPTREARVFSSMAGDIIIDNRQHRILSMSGRLMYEIRFGGGILGKLKEGSSFSLEQEQVGPSLWQLTAFHVRLEGNALLFKSISLQEDDKRSDFEPEPSTVTINQAATEVMSQPETADF